MSIAPTSRWARLLLAGLAAVVALALTYAAGVYSAPLFGPGEDSPEAGFARDMSTHHAQAVEMAMLAYQKATNAEGKVEFLADGSADFANAVGLAADFSAGGMGVRSRRYSMLVEDGVVKQLNIEEKPGTVEVSGGDTLLGQL